MVNIPFFKKVESQPGERFPEWVMIELQGDLQTDSDVLAGQELGTLYLASANSSPRKSSAYDDMDSSFRGEGKAVLLIGNYALTGEVVVLKKPFALVRKSKHLGDSSSVLEIDAVIRRKVLFRQRPRHIVPSSALPK